MKLKYFICNDVSKSENLDTAFQNVSQQVLARVSPELRQHPSAAPSPILQSLIQLQYQSKEAENTKTNIHTISPGNVIPSVSAVQDIDPQQGDDLSGPRPSLLERQLLKRGLAPKDPLLRRFAALKSKRSASSSSKNSNLSALSEAAPVSHSFLNSVPSGRGMAKHWTRRGLSEMTPSSWTIFREQLGIDITPVNVRHPSEREGSSSQGSAASATRAVYTVDTVNPIRCWDEVRLPFALGCCVASFYDLPTAIQAQCIPLAMVELPSAIVSARQADSRGPPNPEVLNKIDIIGVAETGSGKTLSYLIPALVDICSRRPKLLGNHELIALGPMALIMVPTRELAEQVVREALTLLNPDVSKVRFAIKVANLGGKSSNPGNDSEGKSLIHEWEEHELSDLPNDASRVAYRREHNMLSEIRVVKVVGGEKAEEQFEKLSRGAHIVVGTIGQLAALLEDRFLSLANTQFVVVDEADRMIDERQQDTLIAVLERCPKPRQTLLFTATMSRACEEIARRYLSPKGFFVVRTLHRCASIRQNFELIPLIDNSKPEVHAKKKVSSRVSVLKNPKDLANEAVLRRLDPLIYPLKFNRLVTWLVHASGPIIIFAGEKRVCDALQDELRREAGHLAQILNERGLPPTGKGLMDVPSVDAPPRGLVFQEDTGLSLHAAQQRSIAAEETLASALLSSLKLENLTSTAVVHSELSQSERRRLTGLFHRQERKVLITTDLLSRGLDVPGVALVINYDLPWPSEKAPPGGTQRGSQETPDEAFVKYIHRIGRTGRAGATGIALSFVSLPLARVQKAASAIVARAAANGSGFHTQGPSGGRRGDELSRQIYPPGTTDAVKQRDRDRFELTHHHGDSYINTAFGSSEDDGVLNDVENDDDSDRESSRSSDGPRRPQKHFRGEEVTSTTLEGAESREYPSLYSDESLLGPLWKFLIQCIEGNGYSRSEAVRALLQQTYSKIDLPPALALIMHELSTQKGRYGTITQ